MVQEFENDSPKVFANGRPAADARRRSGTEGEQGDYLVGVPQNCCWGGRSSLVASTMRGMDGFRARFKYFGCGVDVIARCKIPL